MVCSMSREFSITKTLLLLYSALSRSHMEYASVLYNKIRNSNYLKLERVPNKFLLIYSYRYFRDRLHLVHNSFVMSDHLPRLNQRRDKADLLFLFKEVHGIIDGPTLLAHIFLRIPHTATRMPMPFYVPCPSNNHYPPFRMAKT